MNQSGPSVPLGAIIFLNGRGNSSRQGRWQLTGLRKMGNNERVDVCVIDLEPWLKVI